MGLQLVGDDSRVHLLVEQDGFAPLPGCGDPVMGSADFEEPAE